MQHAFLNQPTIEEAHEAYLQSYSKLPSVRESWNNRKPSLAQFKKRFGKQYEARQRKLAKGEGTSTALLDRKTDLIQEIAEAVKAQILEADPELDEDGVDEQDEGEEPTLIERLQALTKHGAKSATKTNEAPAKSQRTVKPENADKTPTVSQLYRLVHEAIRSGNTYAQLPVRREDAAVVIALMDEQGKDYEGAMRAWRRKAA